MSSAGPSPRRNNHQFSTSSSTSSGVLDNSVRIRFTAGFKSAKKQGCKIVVIDLDEHVFQLRPFELSKYISIRKADFDTGMIDCCYVVFNGEAVAVNASQQTRRVIEAEIETLKPQLSPRLLKLERLRSLN